MFSWLGIFTSTNPCCDTQAALLDNLAAARSLLAMVEKISDGEEATLTVHIKLWSYLPESISPTLLAFNLQIQNTTRSFHCYRRQRDTSQFYTVLVIFKSINC